MTLAYSALAEWLLRSIIAPDVSTTTHVSCPFTKTRSRRSSYTSAMAMCCHAPGVTVPP